MTTVNVLNPFSLNSISFHKVSPCPTFKRQDVRVELRGWVKGDFGFSAFNKKTGEKIADMDFPEWGGISEEEALDHLEAIGIIAGEGG